jgi:agmatinase
MNVDHLRGTSNRTLTLAPGVILEVLDLRSCVLRHTASGRRIQLSRDLFEMIRQSPDVGVPASFAVIAASEQHVEWLLSEGFVIDRAAVPATSVPSSHRTLRSVNPTLFGAPALRPDRPSADLTFLGAPYDGGNVVRPGCRRGPSDVRSASQGHEYRLDVATGKPAGWVDVDDGRRVLQGVTMADWGDVVVDYGESPAVFLARVEECCHAIVHAGSCPVLLGGDHSVTFAAVKACCAREPVIVIWLDAHTDCGELITSASPNHRNVARWISGLPHVSGIVHGGLRGYAPGAPTRHLPAAFRTVSAAALERDGAAPLLRAVPPDAACYLSIDIDVLDPTIAPGTATPVPQGLGLRAMKTIVADICRARTIVGLDLVEVEGSRDPAGMTALCGVQILMAALAARAERAAAQTEV